MANGVAVESAGNVEILNQTTRLDIPAERVLHQARAAGLTDVIVIGWDQDGDFYFSGSASSGSEVLWLLEKAKQKLLAIGED